MHSVVAWVIGFLILMLNIQKAIESSPTALYLIAGGAITGGFNNELQKNIVDNFKDIDNIFKLIFTGLEMG